MKRIEDYSDNWLDTDIAADLCIDPTANIPVKKPSVVKVVKEVPVPTWKNSWNAYKDLEDEL